MLYLLIFDFNTNKFLINCIIRCFFIYTVSTYFLNSINFNNELNNKRLIKNICLYLKSDDYLSIMILFP